MISCTIPCGHVTYLGLFTDTRTYTTYQLYFFCLNQSHMLDVYCYGGYVPDTEIPVMG